MERTRAIWTDERLDDLAREMNDGFNRVDHDLRLLHTEMNVRIDSLHTRMDSMQRTMVHVGGGMIAAFLAGFLGLIAAQL